MLLSADTMSLAAVVKRSIKNSSKYRDAAALFSWRHESSEIGSHRVAKLACSRNQPQKPATSKKRLLIQ